MRNSPTQESLTSISFVWQARNGTESHLHRGYEYYIQKFRFPSSLFLVWRLGWFFFLATQRGRGFFLVVRCYFVIVIIKKLVFYSRRKASFKLRNSMVHIYIMSNNKKKHKWTSLGTYHLPSCSKSPQATTYNHHVDEKSRSFCHRHPPCLKCQRPWSSDIAA